MSIYSMKFSLIIILKLFFIGICLGQPDSTKLVRYDFSFKFKDGLYLNFSNIKNNSSLPFERIIEPSYNNEYFFEYLDTVATIKYYDDFGTLNEVKKSKIWGYSKNGRPYIYWSDKFNMIPYIGSISHFFTNVIVTQYYDSYDPFYGTYYYRPSQAYNTEVLKQFLIDFETGNIFELDYRNVGELLEKSPELYKEYSKLSKRKKNKKMFDYIRLYNLQVPIYFPN